MTTEHLFSEWVATHKFGELDRELGAALAEVVREVRQHGKSGTVSLKIGVSTKGRATVVADKVTVSTPSGDRESALYFADAEGGLHLNDPNQQRLELGTVPARPTLVPTFDPETGEIADEAVGG